MTAEITADSLPGTGQSSQVVIKEKMIPEREHLAALNKMSDKLGESGRTIASLTSERDSLKAAAAELVDAKEEVASLTKQLDEMSKDDPDRQLILKMTRDAEAALKAANAKNTDANKRFGERELRQEKYDRDDMIIKIANAYMTATGEDTSSADLITAAEEIGIVKADRVPLERLAKLAGWKVRTEAQKPPEIPPADSGRNNGGADDLSKLTPQQKIALGIKQRQKR